jgi:hypothetical protein
MNAPKDSKVDASEFKGVLPAHMRQGIPPYLQVLFAARPKLPFLPPIVKPHPSKNAGFFGSIDYTKMVEVGRQAKENGVSKSAEIPDTSLTTFTTSINKAKRARKWKERLEAHLARQSQEYNQWVADRNKSVGNRSYEPRNTLVVSKLVI